MSPLVVDASVAIKWVVEEEGSQAAAMLLDGPGLAAPDLLMPECANILWKKVRRGELAPEEARLAAELLQRAAVELVPMRPLMPAALALAVRLDHPAYDCAYLALAVERDHPFVTADTRLARLAAQKDPAGLGRRVVPLSQAAAP